MTNHDLMNLLEGRPSRAEVRLAVALPFLPPLELALIGAVTTKTVGMPLGTDQPETVWLLSGAVLGVVPPWWWLPCRRLRP